MDENEEFETPEAEKPPMSEKEQRFYDEELERRQRELDIENEDLKEDAQRQMAWTSLIMMALYPFAVLIAWAADFQGAAEILGNMADMYFIAVAGIVAAYFGGEAYVKRYADKKTRRRR